MAANPNADRGRLVAARRWLVRLGVVLLVPSLLYLALGVAGIVPTAPFAIGAGSGVRTIASLAVLGCLLAAIGHWDAAKE